MDNRKIFNLLGVLSFAFALTACGEQFTGDFVGSGQITKSSCFDADSSLYDLRVEAAISGGDATLRIKQMSAPGQGFNDPFIQIYQGQAVNLSVIDNEELYTDDPYYATRRSASVDLQNVDINNLQDSQLENFDYIVTTGFVNKARDQLSSIQMDVSTILFANDGTSGEQCDFTLIIPELNLQK